MKSLRFQILLVSIFVSSVVFAQDNPVDSRSELWQGKRQEKMEAIVPEKPNAAERVFLKLEEGGIKLNYKGFYPQFASLSTGSGLAPGVRYWKPRFLTSFLDLQATAAYSFKGYQQYTFQLGRILQQGPEPLVGEEGSGGLSQFRGLKKRDQDHFIYADIRYRNFPQEDFFGIGPNVENDDRTDYGIEQTTIDGVAGVRLASRLVAALRAGIIKVNIGPGEDDRFPNTETVFNPITAPGLNEQPDFARFASTIFFDARDVPGNPTNGAFLGFEFARFNDRDDGAFDFNRFTIDARGYVALGSPQRVLATRFLTTLDDTDGGSRVPFYFQETLGGSSTLRGFREFRFRDNNRMLLSAEYRWEAAPALEFALFYDAGKVFPDRDNFDFEDLETDWGIGVRFKLPESVFMRIDTARSDEGTRFYLKFSSSF